MPSVTSDKNPRAAISAFALVAIVVAAVYFNPAPSRDTGRAGAAICASNLRQLYVAFSQYASDNNGDLPPYNADPLMTPRAKFSVRGTAGQKLTYLPVHPELLVASLLPYTKTTGLWHCPDDPYAPGHRGGPTIIGAVMTNHAYSSYVTFRFMGLDRYPVTLQGISFGRKGHVEHSGGGSTDPLLYEEEIPISPQRLWIDAVFGVGTRRSAAAYTHDGRLNAVMFDGHVEAIKAP